MVELAIYAFLAIFIFFRLYNSLGRTSDLNFSSLHINNEVDGEFQLISADIQSNESQDNLLLNSIEKNKIDKAKLALKNIRRKDKNFSLQNFVNASTSAFELIIKAFNQNNVSTLHSLLDDKLCASFVKEINARQNLKKIHENIIISIKSQEILNIRLVKNTAYIAMRFITEQINFVKNKAGDVIAGSMSKINTVEDLWQFKKDVTSGSQKWYLISTDYKTE